MPHVGMTNGKGSLKETFCPPIYQSVGFPQQPHSQISLITKNPETNAM